MLATSAAPHLFWITSRAAGSAALILSSLAVCLGLMMGGRFVKRRGVDLRSTHEALSLATLVAIAVHAVALLGDGFLKPSIADLTIPFVSGYMTFWTTTGIIESVRPGGGSSTGSRPWPGSSASSTRWARARTPAPPGSWR